MKKMRNLTKVVGALSLGALALTGCKSNEAEADANGEATTEGEKESCGGAEGEKCGGEEGGSCGGEGGK